MPAWADGDVRELGGVPGGWSGLTRPAIRVADANAVSITFCFSASMSPDLGCKWPGLPVRMRSLISRIPKSSTAPNRTIHMI